MKFFRRRRRSSQDRNSALGILETAQPTPILYYEPYYDDAAQSWEYPKSLEEGDIRLVEILPGKPEDRLQIVMHHVLFKDGPQFAYINCALDWEEPKSYAILCDGKHTAVQPMSARILKSLRENKVYGINLYWIRDLCFDHSNERDENAIHRYFCLRAQLTIGWTDIELSASTVMLLGQVATITRAPCFLEDCLSVLQGRTCITADNLDRYENEYKALLLEDDELRAFREINGLLNAKFFQSASTLQELVLPNQILLRCISVDLAWEMLCGAIKTMFMFGAHATLELSQVENLLVADLLRQRRNLSHLTFAECLLAVHGCRFDGAHALDLFDSLAWFSNLAPGLRRPDDEGGPRAHAFMDRSVSMSIDLGLPISLALSGLSKEGSMASWVPNYDVQQLRLVLGHPNSNFSTSTVPFETTNDALFHDHENDGCLEDPDDTSYLLIPDYNSPIADLDHYDILEWKCRGYKVDNISTVQSYLPPRRICDQYDTTGYNLSEFVRWYEYARSTEIPNVPNGSDALLLRFTEVIQARGCNHIWESDRPVPPQRTMSLARDFLAYLEDPDIRPTNAIRVFAAACLPSCDRRFGLTSFGSFCLLPANTLPGDLVWVIRGLKTPIVLRQAGAFYRNVGECYVEGIMFGEAEGNDEDIKII